MNSFVQKKKEINPCLKWRVVGPAANSSLHIFFLRIYILSDLLTEFRFSKGTIFFSVYCVFDYVASCKFKEEGGGGVRILELRLYLHVY